MCDEIFNLRNAKKADVCSSHVCGLCGGISVVALYYSQVKQESHCSVQEML